MNPMTKFPEIFNLTVLPLVPLRELVAFISDIPMCPLNIGRGKSKRALEKAGVTLGSGLIFLCTKTNSDVENPSINDLYDIGVVTLAGVSTKSKEAIKAGADTYKILHGGVYPAKLLSLFEEDDVTFANIQPFAPWYPEETVGHHWKKISEMMAFAKTTGLADEVDLVRLWGVDSKPYQLMNFCYSLIGAFDYKCQQELIELETPEKVIEHCYSLLKKKYQSI